MVFIKLILDDKVIENYESYYFKKYPRRKKKPIISPHHPLLNKWSINRILARSLKESWNEFVIWWINDMGLNNQKIDSCDMIFITYKPTKRLFDPDGTVPKFILDGFVQGGLLQSDDYTNIRFLTLAGGYDREHPRTEIIINKLDRKTEEGLYGKEIKIQ